MKTTDRCRSSRPALAEIYYPTKGWGVMVKKVQESRRVAAHVNLEDYGGLILAYPELSRVRKLLESVRQGVVMFSGSRTVEAALALFTSMLKMEMVVNWEDAYEEVEVNELLNDARPISLPAMWEVPLGGVLVGTKIMPVGLRRAYIVLSSIEIYGIIIWGQPSIGLLAMDRESHMLYLGFHGIDEEGNDQLIMEKSSYGDKDLAIDS
jgi:hypothetical protein